MSTASALLENWKENLKMLNVEGVAEFLTFGFTLGEKTMRKDLTIPPLQMPEIDCSKTSRIEDVYEALKEYMAKAIRPDSGLALSGGLDSRVLAGIVAELGEKIPTFTYGTSSFEKTIARKVAASLELPHYEIDINWSLSEKVIEELAKVVMERGGTNNVVNLYVRMRTLQYLRTMSVNTLFFGTGFDEVNGAQFAHKINSVQQFCDVFVQIFAHPLLPHEYREIARKNLNECCKNVPFCKVFPFVYFKNQFKHLTVSPLLDKKVLSAIVSLPYEGRINKRMQRAILRKYFPKLYKIPYTISGLAPSMPYFSHVLMRKLVGTSYIPRKKPRPLLTVDYQWFIKNNIELYKKYIYAHIPPLLDVERVQRLIYRLRTNASLSMNTTSKDGVFLDQLLTYALLVSRLDKLNEN